MNPAWNVAPDSTSVVQIASTTDRCVIYHNTLKGKDDYGTRLTASCGIVAYGGCNEWIAEANTITAMRSAIYLAGLAQYSPSPVTTTCPCDFHYYANNVIQKCSRGIFCFAEFPVDKNGVPLVAGPRLGFLGNTFRRNNWSDLIACGIGFDGSTTGWPVDLAVFEHNTFTNLSQGINFRSEGHDAEAVNTVLYKNAFDRGTAPFLASFGAYFLPSTVAPVLRENTWTGFQTTYAGTPPGPALELPGRTFALQTPVGSAAVVTAVTLENAGTARLDWTALSDASWLTLSASSGTVPNESSLSSLTLTCDPSGLPPGTYVGNVSLTAGTQTTKITVPFTVGPPITPPGRLRIVISEITATTAGP